MNNYPDNVDPRSPDCPWNQKDPVMIDCPECDGTGVRGLFDENDDYEEYDEKIDCLECDGTGQIESEE